MFLSITVSPWWVNLCFCLEFALAHWDFLPLTWTSLPKCGKITQVLAACPCESAEPSQASVSSSRPICSILVSILINTSCAELLFWLELLGTVMCHGTWCTPLACEPGPMISTPWVTQRVGDVLPWCPSELFSPQLPSCDRSDVDCIPLHGTGRDLMTKRTLVLGRIPDCISSVTLQIVRNYSLLILHFEACFVEA